MKKILMLALAALSVSGGLTGRSATLSAVSLQPADAISSIRQRYAIINRSLGKYRRVKKELSGFSTEGGELVAYFDGKVVMKIATINLGETGRSFEDFYYWDEKLIFVFRKEDTYTEPFSGKVARSTENRFYFSDGKLIRWIDEKARPVAPGGSEYREKQNNYLRASARLVADSRSLKTIIEAPADTP
ncbi:MAG TPA: hypothetical protein VEZ40_03385 [Pyrinomonadaceae bacterium]|nr:hypothetical protein [Pyrinomonadaceae bacterium]